MSRNPGDETCISEIDGGAGSVALSARKFDAKACEPRELLEYFKGIFIPENAI